MSADRELMSMSNGWRGRSRTVIGSALLLAALVAGGVAWDRWDQERREQRSQPGPGPAGASREDELERQMRELAATGYSSTSNEALGEVGVTVHVDGQVTPGVNLYVSGHGPEVLLIDNRGAELHRWRMPFAEAFPERAGEFPDEATIPFRRALLVPDGRLLAIYESRGLIALDRDSRLLWTYSANVHHDVKVAPDGNVYALIREVHVVPDYHAESPILEDYVAILDAGGVEQRRISLLECLRSGGHLPEKRRGWGDIFHTNSLEILDGAHAARSEVFRAGNVLLSMRNTDHLVIVDLEARRSVWTLRGPWLRQHDPSLLASGSILLFNNRSAGQPSTVLEVDPLSGKRLWQVRSSDTLPFQTSVCGAARRLSTGNTLIVGSEQARALEVTCDGELVWEFRNPNAAPDNPANEAMLFDLIRIEAADVLDWLR